MICVVSIRLRNKMRARRAKDKAKKLQTKEMLAGGIIGLSIGVMKTRMPSLISGFGPGNKLNIDWLLFGGGAYLAFYKKGTMREYGSAAMVIGLARLAEPYGEQLGAGGIPGFGGGE